MRGNTKQMHRKGRLNIEKLTAEKKWGNNYNCMLDVVKTYTSTNSGCGGDALKDPPYSELIICKDGGSP